MSAVIRFVLLSLVLAGVAVLVDPASRATIARVELFVLVAALAVLLVRRIGRRAPPLPPSPFEPRRAAVPGPSRPADLERIAIDVRAIGAPGTGGRLPGGVRALARGIAARRLADHHGLDLDDPADAAAVRRVVGEDMWAALSAHPTSLTGADLADQLGRL